MHDKTHGLREDAVVVYANATLAVFLLFKPHPAPIHLVVGIVQHGVPFVYNFMTMAWDMARSRKYSVRCI